ncbi:MAG TPA: carbohydrate ABC transporter permease [Casimicrobiaceae bacterium]|jgi:multiple sugar transport system permease protein|nr:carbohydrate ABC transporter permease [Casimicrobiaceae bacterium]
MGTARARRTVLLHAVLVACAAIVIVPAMWIALAAFKTQIALLRGDVLFKPYLGNFDELLFSRSADYGAHFANSVIVATSATALVLVVATLAAYSMHRMRWPRWVPALIAIVSLVFYMLPPITLVGPWYVMFRTLGLDNTYIALVLANVTLNLPVGVAVMSVFVRDIPVELEQAARLDGCTTPQMLWRIVVPLVRPGLAATAILVFVFSWNEFAVALTLSGSRTATVPVAIAKFAQEYEIKNGVMAAGVVLSIVPAIVLLLFAHRHIVKGLTAGVGK